MTNTTDSIIAKPLADPAITNFLLTMLTSYWKRSNLPFHQLPGIFLLLQRNADDSEQAMLALHHYYPEMKQAGSLFMQRYQQARARKFDYYAQYLSEHVRPGVLVDIGAGDIQLVDNLVSNSAGITDAYATDIFPSNLVSKRHNVHFVVQESETATPFEDNAADTIIISTMLHHMQPNARQKLLRHVFSVLKPGGVFLLVEDSFPEDAPLANSELEHAFLSLTKNQRMQCLYFLDWWGNRLMKNRPEIPLPCTFKTIDEWHAYLQGFGFEDMQAEFYGFPELPTHMVAPKVIMAATKTTPV